MKHFRLYGNCIIVKGASKALIYDLFRSRTLGISLQLAELYEMDMIHHPINTVLQKYAEFETQIVQLIDNLIENDFGFFTEEPDSFPSLDIAYKAKKRVYSCVIELNTSQLYKYEKVIYDLLAKDCSIFYLLVRNEIENPGALKDLLKLFKKSRATWVQVIFDKPYLDYEEMRHVTNDMRVKYKVYGTDKNQVVKGRWWYEESIYEFDLVEYKTAKFDLSRKSNYGNDYFMPTQAVFIESQAHNVFFNQRVCISKEGDYKNDLSFSKSYGNIASKSVSKLLEDDAFKKLWYLSNDKIETCKDCQFRYQCVSNSDVVERDMKYFKSDYCRFNPYSNEWEELEHAIEQMR